MQLSFCCRDMQSSFVVCSPTGCLNVPHSVPLKQNDRKGSLTSPMVWSTAMVLPKTGGVPSVKISTRKRGWCVHVTAARFPEG